MMKSHSQKIAAAFTLVGASLNAAAQQAAPAAGERLGATAAKSADSAAPDAVVKVEVKGDYDPRRDDTASKTVIRQEDITRYGDTNVFDVLKRAPGVTVVGESIRMRGLGNGYTQILVNGERPPAGFQLSTVAPEQIERIEIIRAATAEFSTRAIAGTVNIVMKRVVTKPQRDLRINGSHSGQATGAGANLNLANRSGNLSYFVTAALNHGSNHITGDNAEQFSTPSGVVQQLRDYRTDNESKNDSATLASRLTWKLASNDTLTWGATLTGTRQRADLATTYFNRIGTFPAPDYRYRNGEPSDSATYASSSLNWITQLAGGKLDTSAAIIRSIRDSHSHFLSSTADRQLTLRRDSDSDIGDTTLRSGGKYSRTVFEGHALVTGWEASRQTSNNDRLRTEGYTDRSPTVTWERFEPKITQLAAFLQDEWNVSKQWSMYLGTRWEGIRTDSSLSGKADTSSRSHVLSPIAQTLYKFPDKSGRQLRLALTRTYKAPTLGQLTARRNYADLNTRFTPDSSGNPNLQPELATGVDLTYEHFWAPTGVFSVSASQRHISNYIRTTLSQDSQGLWLYQPVNDSDAQVRSLDMELKFPSKLWWPQGPALDLRGSINRNWSRVTSVPGPDNRLDQQIPISAVLGVDYKADPYTMGSNLAFRSGGPVRISVQETKNLQVRRDLDAYVAYKISPTLQLRATAANLLPKANQDYSRYQDLSGITESWGSSPSSRRWQLSLEMKL